MTEKIKSIESGQRVWLSFKLQKINNFLSHSFWKNKIGKNRNLINNSIVKKVWNESANKSTTEHDLVRDSATPASQEENFF